MKNNLSDSGLALGFLLVSVFVVSWFSQQFNLDAPTSANVLIRHIIFGISSVGLIYLVLEIDIGIITILPICIVGYLCCWLPALDYWAEQDFGNMHFDGEAITYAWYGTGWIQALISMSILVIGYGLIYYFGSRSRY